MDDLEICKRIAEIENYRGWEKMSTRGIAGVFNPLTDDALCFRLMVKYKMDFIPYYPDEYRAQIKNTYVVNKSPNKAICLAIIEANK